MMNKPFNDDLMRWYVCTRKTYDKIPPLDRDPNGCYFTLDTREVILEDVCYTGMLIFYSGEKPSHPTTNRLYCNTDDFEISVWTGANWLIIYGTANAQLLSADPNVPVTQRVVSGAVVEDYARRLLIDTILDYAKIVKLSYNENRHKLDFQIGEAEQPDSFVISNIGNKLLLDSNTNTLHLLDENNVSISSFVMFPRHIIQGEFNFTDMTIDFNFSSGPPIKVPCAGMLNLFKTEDTMTIMTKANTAHTFNMRVKRSHDPDNIFELRDDGIFANYSRYMDLIQPGFSDIILISNNKGQAYDGSVVSKRISERYLQRYMNGDPNAILTEEIVWESLSHIHDAYLPKRLVWKSPIESYYMPKALAMKVIPNT